MATSVLYFGPYNDPFGPTVAKHSVLPHTCSCQNPAIIVRKKDNIYTIQVAVRNVSAEASPDTVSVSFYGRPVPPNLTLSQLNELVTNLVGGHSLGTSKIGVGQCIAPYSPANDCPWIAGPVAYTSRQPRGMILAATLTCSATPDKPGWNLGRDPKLDPTCDPCVAVWVGP